MTAARRLGSIVLAAGLAVGSAWAAAGADASRRNLCELFYDAGWKPVEGMKVMPETPSVRPPKGIPFRDPVHGTCVVRVTEHDKEPPRGFARAEYSRRQSFNADSSRLLVVANDGAWHLYDSNTYAHLEMLSALQGDAEPQWHPTDPDRLWFLPRNGVGMKLEELDLRSGRARTVADFAARLKARWPEAAAAWTKDEGSPSADGRTWCFMVDDAQWKGLGLFTWDRETDRILGMLDLHGDRPDHVSMSPSGSYCVASGLEAGTVAYSRDFKERRVLLKGTEHSDIARDVNGDDVYVAVDYDAHTGPVFMTNLRTGVRTDLFPTYLDGTTTALHISGKAYDAPGWVVISTYADAVARGRPGPQWLHRRIFAVSLEAKPRIVDLAHHQSRYAKYWTEPQASVNRDGTRIVFNSNWGTASETDVDTFMVVLPPRMPWSRR